MKHGRLLVNKKKINFLELLHFLIQNNKTIGNLLNFNLPNNSTDKNKVNNTRVNKLYQLNRNK